MSGRAGRCRPGRRQPARAGPRRCTASVRPSTNTGMLTPNSETTVTMPSTRPCAWRAASRPSGMPSADREQHRGDGQLDRRREPDHELRQDRLVVDDARAEVAVEQLAQVDRGTAARAAGRGRGTRGSPSTRSGVACWPRIAVGRVARQQVDEREQDDRQAEQDRDRREQAPDDVLEHGRVLPRQGRGAVMPPVADAAGGMRIGQTALGRRASSPARTVTWSSQTELKHSVRVAAADEALDVRRGGRRRLARRRAGWSAGRRAMRSCAFSQSGLGGGLVGRREGVGHGLVAARRSCSANSGLRLARAVVAEERRVQEVVRCRPSRRSSR